MRQIKPTQLAFWALAHFNIVTYLLTYYLLIDAIVSSVSDDDQLTLDITTAVSYLLYSVL